MKDINPIPLFLILILGINIGMLAYQTGAMPALMGSKLIDKKTLDNICQDRLGENYRFDKENRDSHSIKCYNKNNYGLNGRNDAIQKEADKK